MTINVIMTFQRGNQREKHQLMIPVLDPHRIIRPQPHSDSSYHSTLDICATRAIFPSHKNKVYAKDLFLTNINL